MPTPTDLANLDRCAHRQCATGTAQTLIGGPTAATVDLLDSIADRLPLMAGLVVAAMLVLLFLAFGSVVLPLKAVLMNALSLLASFGFNRGR